MISQENRSDRPRETAGPGELVQIAVVYHWTSVTIYRNGEKYAQYDVDNRHAFPEDSILLIGKQYLDCYSFPTMAGSIEEARLYNVALSPEMIALLKPNEPSPIGPIGLWTFEDGTARDSTGHFPMGQLQGNARIANGRLILDGRNSFLAVPAIGGIKETTRLFSSDFERGIGSWYAQKASSDLSAVGSCAGDDLPRDRQCAGRLEGSVAGAHCL